MKIDTILDEMVQKSNSNINDLNEILKAYKNIVLNIESYISGISSNNYPLCVKKISDSEEKIKQIKTIISEKLGNENFHFKGIDEITQIIGNEKNKLSALEKEMILDFGQNISSNLESCGLKIQGGDVSNGIKIKNFLLEFDKRNFKINIFYLAKKEKFAKIDGLDTKLAAEKINEFYKLPQFQTEQIQKYFTDICGIYSKLSIEKNASNIELGEIMNEFLIKIESYEKLPIDKRIFFSYILFLINRSSLKTMEQKSIKMNWATGDNIANRKIQLDIPTSEIQIDSRNISHLELI